MTKIESLMKEAINLINSGKPNQAKEQFNKVTTLMPDDHSMKAVIGSIFWDYEMFEEAFDHLYSVVEFRNNIDPAIKRNLSDRIISGGLGAMSAMSDSKNGMKVMELHQLALKLNDQQMQMNFNLAIFKMMMEPEWLERWDKMDWIGTF